MSIIINTDNSISIDGVATGLRVTQRREGTIVYSADHGGLNYKEYKMRFERYSLSHDSPLSGVPGRKQFEIDIRTLNCTPEQQP